MSNSTQKTTLYRYFDSTGQLLYVGITRVPMQRQKQHSKSAHWFESATSATYEHFETRAQAESAEVQAIKNERPLHNIAHAYQKPDSTYKDFQTKLHFMQMFGDKDLQGRPWKPDQDHQALAFFLQSLDTTERNNYKSDFGFDTDELVVWSHYEWIRKVTPTCISCLDIINTLWYKEAWDAGLKKIDVVKRKQMDIALRARG